MFNSVSKYKHSKDQLQTIEKFVEDIKNGKKEQVLLGATGTGKTFTIANVIKKVNKPTLFESLINSCINMCELIDYIGYYPSTRQGKILKWKI